MAKMLPSQQGTLLQSEVAEIIHDKVISLCQKKYNSVNFIEIDGIICISLLDTKEQQVVKIHKTLTSISGKPSKSTSRKKAEDHSLLQNLISSSTNVPAGSPNSLICPNGEQGNYQDDINTLSDLLKNTTDKINLEKDEKKSKRKRKQPRQRPALEADPENVVKKTKESSLSNDLNNEEYHCSPGINPFIHPESAVRVNGPDLDGVRNPESESQKEGFVLTKVKDEPVDPEFDNMDESVPKIENVYSVTTNSEENQTKGEKMEKVSSIIDRLIEKDYERRENTPSDMEGTVTQELSHMGNENVMTDDGTSADMVVVKVEKMSEDSEYGGISSNNDTADESDVAGASVAGNILNNDGGQDEYHALQNSHSSGETRPIENRGLMQALAQVVQAKIDREYAAVQEKSWIDMVKNNVSKYQAALVKKTGNTKAPMKLPDLALNENNASGKENVAMVQPTGSSTTASSTAFNLLNLLQRPPMYPQRVDMLRTGGQMDNVARSSSFSGRDSIERPVRSSSVPKNASCVNTNSDRSSSCSPSPVVKIEVDDVEDNLYGGNTAQAGDSKGQSENEVNLSNPVEKPSGKLESRYPALFNQLQVPKQDQPGTNTSNSDQADSLVNRLPFISFQEIFSSAATGSDIPRMSESTTRQLLEKAKVSPYPSKTKPKKKSIWNWKKRVVRSKGQDDSSPETMPESEINDFSSEKGKPLGIHMSAKKTFAKRNSKNSSDSDQEWRPEMDSEVINLDDVNGESGGRRTRRSMGKKPRINFAEIYNSDIDMEDESEPPIELVSAHCNKNCGRTFQTLRDLEAHEEQCRGGNSGVQSSILGAIGSSEQQVGSAAVTGTGGNNKYNCTLCGLDFNQEYRWHYHMIKVHGITAEKIKFFR